MLMSKITGGGDDCLLLHLQLDQLRHVAADAPGEKVVDQQAGHLAQEVELLEGGGDVGLVDHVVVVRHVDGGLLQQQLDSNGEIDSDTRLTSLGCFTKTFITGINGRGCYSHSMALDGLAAKKLGL